MSKLDDLMTSYNMDVINDLTKYPDIQDFFKIENGKYIDELNVSLNDNSEIYIYEKIDGILSRVILYDGDFFMGDKIEITHARGDRILIKPNIFPIYSALSNFLSTYQPLENRVMVIFGESFGNEMKGKDRYTSTKKTAFRMFDGFSIPVQAIQAFSNMTPEQRKSWRNSGQQHLWSVNTLINFSGKFNVPFVPDVWEGYFRDMPYKINDVRSWVKNALISDATLDGNPLTNDQQDTPEEQEQTQQIQQTETSQDTVIKQEIDEDEIIPGIKTDSPQSNTQVKHSDIYGKAEGIVLRDKTSRIIRKIDFNKLF